LDRLASALRRLDLLYVHGPAARAQLLALGANPSLLRDGRSAIDEFEPGLAQQPRAAARILYVGRLHHEKGPDVLLGAVALLGRDVAVEIVGSGPMEAALREQARALGLDRVVSFVGWQVDPARWIAGASVCVVPSRFDAWSQTAVLAMALRVPVVASAVDGLAHVVGDGRGIAVPPDDPAALAWAIRAVLEEPALVDLDAARSYASRFTADAVADYYEGCYGECLEGRRLQAA
jgi:glycosyltransferase involved in cell wall biosynthesis